MSIKVKHGGEVTVIPDCLCITAIVGGRRVRVLRHKCPAHGASPTWLVVALKEQLSRARP